MQLLQKQPKHLIQINRNDRSLSVNAKEKCVEYKMNVEFQQCIDFSPGI